MLNGKDPKLLVNNLLASGQMSKAQFEALSNQANNIMSLIK